MTKRYVLLFKRRFEIHWDFFGFLGIFDIFGFSDLYFLIHQELADRSSVFYSDDKFFVGLIFLVLPRKEELDAFPHD
jgi:hypothetical protein